MATDVIEVLSGETKGTRVPFGQRLSIGRDPKNGLYLRDRSVSRMLKAVSASRPLSALSTAAMNRGRPNGFMT